MDLISRIFVKDPNERISIAEIKAHRWFTKSPPKEIPVSNFPDSTQSVEEIRSLIEKARVKDESGKPTEVDDLLSEAMNDETTL